MYIERTKLLFIILIDMTTTGRQFHLNKIAINKTREVARFIT